MSTVFTNFVQVSKILNSTSSFLLMAEKNSGLKIPEKGFAPRFISMALVVTVTKFGATGYKTFTTDSSAHFQQNSKYQFCPQIWPNLVFLEKTVITKKFTTRKNLAEAIVLLLQPLPWRATVYKPMVQMPVNVIPRAEKAIAHPPTWTLANCWR